MTINETILFGQLTLPEPEPTIGTRPIHSVFGGVGCRPWRSPGHPANKTLVSTSTVLVISPVAASNTTRAEVRSKLLKSSLEYNRPTTTNSLLWWMEMNGLSNWVVHSRSPVWVSRALSVSLK